MTDMRDIRGMGWCGGPNITPCIVCMSSGHKCLMYVACCYFVMYVCHHHPLGAGGKPPLDDDGVILLYESVCFAFNVYTRGLWGIPTHMTQPTLYVVIFMSI